MSYPNGSKFEIVAIGEAKPDLVSSLIQKKIKANYSHIGILVDGLMLYHATGKGFHQSYLPNELNGGESIVRRRVAIPVCCPRFALGWLKGRLGTEYSTIQYLGFIFPVLRFIPFINNGRRETVCSEIAADFIEDCAIMQDWKVKDSDFVDPKQIMDIAAGMYGEERGNSNGM